MRSPLRRGVVLEELPGDVDAGEEAREGNLSVPYTAMRQALLGFFRKHTNDAAISEDLVQEVFLKAVLAEKRGVIPRNISAWLYKIALNQCRDRAKSKSARQQRATIPLSELPITPPCSHASPDHAAASNEDLEKLHEGIQALPVGLREPLLLFVMEGLSQQEAADVLGCSVRALEGRLYRARQALMAWWK